MKNILSRNVLIIVTTSIFYLGGLISCDTVEPVKYGTTEDYKIYRKVINEIVVE